MCHTIRILAQSLMIILGLWNMHPLGLLMPSIRLCIILVTFLIDSILKWGASTEVLNFFKFRFILYDPSFLGCIKILEKYPCPSCGDLTITPFFKSFSTSKFITKTYLQWYKYGALPTTILFRFTFRPFFTITKMKWSDIIFAHMLQ